MSKPDEIARLIEDATSGFTGQPCDDESTCIVTCGELRAIAAAIAAERTARETAERAEQRQIGFVLEERAAREKAEAETLAVLRREAETTARIDARLDKAEATARAAALREAAEALASRNGLIGCQYAADIVLALIDKEPVSHDTPR